MEVIGEKIENKDQKNHILWVLGEKIEDDPHFSVFGEFLGKNGT